MQKSTNSEEPWLDFKWRFEGDRELPGAKGNWGKFYEAVHRTNGEPLAICIYCQTKYRHPWVYQSKPTTSLDRHIASCHAYKRSQQGSQLSTIHSFFNSKQSSEQRDITKTVVEEQVLKFFISGNIPFKQAENEHFHKLVSFIQINNQNALAPSRKVLRARLSKQVVSAKDNLKGILSTNHSKISLALDCWTTRTNFGFLGIFTLCQIIKCFPISCADKYVEP